MKKLKKLPNKKTSIKLVRIKILGSNMKKILLPVAMGLIATAPLAAEDYPMSRMLRDMGYTESYLIDTFATEVEQSNKNAREFYAGKELDNSVKPKKKAETHYGFTKEEVLQPRISDAVESPEMIPLLQRYHKQNPRSAKITRKLAQTCYSSGQYKEALYWFTLTYQRDRSDLDSLWNMAVIADSLGDRKQAVKYLKEYKKVDPNSAWGRMAGELLEGSYSGADMSEAFENKMPSTVEMAGGSNGNAGAKNSDSDSAEGGIIVMQGDKYELETFVANYKPNKNFNSEPTKVSSTSKGNSQPKSTPKIANTSLGSAEIKPTALEATTSVAAVDENADVKTVGTPLGN